MPDAAPEPAPAPSLDAAHDSAPGAAEPRAPARWDVCNGDADGLCAVVQWRLHDPRPATLVTGLKREIELLQRVPARRGDEVLVCDVSLQRNRAALERLLAAGVRVRYFDHHAAQPVPEHPGLEAHIDGAPERCTSLLVDAQLQGRFRRWALVGAYGDNLAAVADALAATMGLAPAQRERLRALGEAINYNAYGEQPGDAHVAPAELYGVMRRHADPLRMAEREPVAAELQALQRDDLARARAVAPLWQGPSGSVHLLPDAAWARRVVGSHANALARAEPERAHAVLYPGAGGGLRASVRAPLRSGGGAHALCARFGGAGRARAAGIDALAEDALPDFIAAFAAARWLPGEDVAGKDGAREG